MKRLLISVATVAAAAGIALAQPAATPRAQGMGGQRTAAAVRQRFLANLNLTADQKTQAKQIMQQAKTAVQPVRQQMQQNRQSLTTAVQSDNTAQIQDLAAKQGSLQGQLLAIRSDARAKVFALLTPEQKAKAEQRQQKIKQLRQQLRALGSNG